MLVCLLAGLFVRLVDLTDLPLDFHPTRQLHSALIARGMFYQNAPGVPQWQRDLALQQWKMEGIIEPPVMEFLAAEAYRAAGAPLLWLPRLFSILFWLAGAAAVAAAARRLTGDVGGIAALLFYLAAPYGVIASRSFQPDPLMTALCAAYWWALLRWHKTDMKTAVLLGALGGLAVFIKSTALFFVIPPFIAHLFVCCGWRNVLRSRPVWVAAVLLVLPYAVYTVYGLWIGGFLQDQFSQRFFPEMWISAGFYLRWAARAFSVVPLGWAAAGFLGVWLVKPAANRAVLWAVYGGYIIYGFVLPHHAGTHDYYHLPLIPLTALGLSPLAAFLWDGIGAADKPRQWGRWAAVVVIGLGVFYTMYQSRNDLRRVNFRPEAIFWNEMGQKLGQDQTVTALTPDYGARLAYWGWVNANHWPSVDDLQFRGETDIELVVQSTFEQMAAGRSRFLVTDFEEYNRQPALKGMLESYFVLDRSEKYVIYDLSRPAEGGTGK